MPVCERWLEGACTLGNKCRQVHGMEKKGRFHKEFDGDLQEEFERGHASERDSSTIEMWRSLLSQMEPGEHREFPGLSVTERFILHDIATSFRFEHRTHGDGSHTVLEIRRPIGPTLERPIMQIEQCLSLPPEDADEVCGMLKRVLAFRQLCKQNRDRKQAMEKEVTKAAKTAYTFLTSSARTGTGKAYHSIEDRDAVIEKLAKLKIQKFDLQANLLGHKLAADLYDLAFVGDRYDEDEVVVNVSHEEPAAELCPERTENQGTSHDNIPDEEEVPDQEQYTEASKIYILQYKRRNTEFFHAALKESQCLRECREAMESAGQVCESQGKGLIFVASHLYDEVCRILNIMDVELRAYTVVISECLKPELEAAFAQLPYRKRPKEDIDRQRSFEIEIEARVPAAAPAAAAEVPHTEPLPNGFALVRTFICSVPSLAEAKSVIQSTTEATNDASKFHFSHNRGMNPRRYIQTE